MGILEWLGLRKEHRFCSYCGSPMASFEIPEQMGFDFYTGKKVIVTRVGWACERGGPNIDWQHEPDVHDGWRSYYADDWKILDG